MSFAACRGRCSDLSFPTPLPQFVVFFLSFLCLESAGLPGDGGWYEVKCDVAMASVTPGDCKQGAALEIVGGWAAHLVRV